MKWLTIIFSLWGAWCFSQDATPEEVKDLKERIDQLEKEVESMRKTRLVDRIEALKKEISEATGGLQFSGFFDVTLSEHQLNPNVFELGDFEFDMEHNIGDHFQVGAALVFNEDQSELAVGFIDYHIYGGTIPSRGRLFDQKGLHIQLGKFDIPFGADWQYYASADRPNIFAPLTTEDVLDGGINDTGLRVLQASAAFNYSVFMIRGQNEGNAYGGRFVLTPFSNPFALSSASLYHVELGGSYLLDIDRSDVWEDKAWGLDLTLDLHGYQFIGEWLEWNQHADRITKTGFQVTSILPVHESPLMSWTLIARYDQTDREWTRYDSSQDSSRASIALNIDIQEVSSLKFEALKDLENQESQVHAQVVVRF